MAVELGFLIFQAGSVSDPQEPTQAKHAAQNRGTAGLGPRIHQSQDDHYLAPRYKTSERGTTGFVQPAHWSVMTGRGPRSRAREELSRLRAAERRAQSGGSPTSLLAAHRPGLQGITTYLPGWLSF